MPSQAREQMCWFLKYLWSNWHSLSHPNWRSSEANITGPFLGLKLMFVWVSEKGQCLPQGAGLSESIRGLSQVYQSPKYCVKVFSKIETFHPAGKLFKQEGEKLKWFGKFLKMIRFFRPSLLARIGSKHLRVPLRSKAVLRSRPDRLFGRGLDHGSLERTLLGWLSYLQAVSCHW